MRRLSQKVAASIIGLCILNTGSIAQTSVQGILDSLVFIQTKKNTGAIIGAGGSGVIINNKGFILTAKHVLGDNFDEEIDQIFISPRSKGSAAVRARLYKCSESKFDICILHVSVASLPTAFGVDNFKLRCSMPARRTPVLAAGFPPGEFSPSTVVSGIISTSEPGEAFKYYMDAATSPGMSGGPVIGPGDTLVGVVHGVGKQTAVFLVAHLGPVKGMLEEAESDCPRESVSVTDMKIKNTAATFDTIARDIGVSNQRPASDGIYIGGGIPQNIRDIARDAGLVVTSGGSAGKLVDKKVATPPKGFVYLHIPSEAEREPAQRAIKVLESGLSPVKVLRGIENVGTNSPKEAEIRYFQDSALPAAEEIKRQLAFAGILNANVKKFNMNAALGQIEIYWPKPGG